MGRRLGQRRATKENRGHDAEHDREKTRTPHAPIPTFPLKGEGEERQCGAIEL
jgi:hypothetical protein